MLCDKQGSLKGQPWFPWEGRSVFDWFPYRDRVDEENRVFGAISYNPHIRSEGEDGEYSGKVLWTRGLWISSWRYWKLPCISLLAGGSIPIHGHLYSQAEPKRPPIFLRTLDQPTSFQTLNQSPLCILSATQDPRRCHTTYCRRSGCEDRAVEGVQEGWRRAYIETSVSSISVGNNPKKLTVLTLA